MENFDVAKQLFLDGLDLLEQGRLAEAEIKFQDSLQLLPNKVSTLLNLSATQIELKKFDEAIINLSTVIGLEENCAEAYLNFGLIQVKLKKFEQALNNFKLATTMSPNYAEAWSNKGNTLHELNRLEDAITAYDQAIKLNPNYAEAWSNKGNTLHKLNRFEDAIAAYDQAIKLNPKKTPFLGNRLHIKMAIAQWENFDSDIKLITEKINFGEYVSEPFPLLSLIDDPSLHLKTAKRVVSARYRSNLTPALISKKIHSKIRVGYFSPDFKSHPVSFLTAELFELHDRNRFETYAFSLQPSDKNDPLRTRLLKAFDHFINVENKTDSEIAELAQNLELDIAVNLGGHTQHSRMGIFPHRAAPIQVNFLGYPGTLGADYIDYIIADKILIPEAHQKFYSEKVAYLPNSYMIDDSKRQPSAKNFKRKDFGLPDDQFIFCCFNNGYKFNPKVLRCWANILLNTSESVLWVSENNELFKRNLINEFSSLGIPPKRIIFAKYLNSMAEHLSRYKLADLFLDTSPFNAHTTAIDALKAGVPLLTLSGETYASKVGASLLTAINLPELITSTQDAYERMAIELAQYPNKLATIKKKLASNYLSAPLFNTPLFTMHLETIYEKMFERHEMGLLPDHLFIE